MNLPETDTIAAIATPPGAGGVGIIKMSGPDSFRIAHAQFIRKTIPPGHTPNASTPQAFESHRFYLGYLKDPATDSCLDEVLITFMKTPRTYTGEDVVEIHAHAGPFVLRKALENMLKAGARLAEPGEFTKRAFLNGKIDLTQAEAVIEIISAQNRQALAFAVNLLKGSAGHVLREIRDQLMDLLSEIEARIDFEEDVETSLSTDLIESRLKDLYQKITAIAKRYIHKRLFGGELKVVIVGSPNVGKSTLMNQLSGKDRAIVTAYPGTTRDVISEPIHIKGLSFVLCDTAGIHETDNEIERIGIQKTRAEIESADLVLYLVDARKGLAESDMTIIRTCVNACLIVRNKSDLVETSHFLGDDPAHMKTVDISALTGYGVDALRRSMYDHFQMYAADPPEGMIPTLRQKLHLEQAGKLLLSGMARMRKGMAPVDLLAIDVKGALDSIRDLLGESRNVDIMDSVFEKFCIGK